MSKYRKGQLYVRRMRPSDNSDSWRLAMRLSFYTVMMRSGEYKGAYVLCRHGMKGIMEVGRTRRELTSTLFMSGCRNFKEIQRKTKHGNIERARAAKTKQGQQ
ncbi:hypothetical protein DZC75_10470 [Pseudomonas parafulva]|uniref:Uncharacterized protein n=1 Tax=Pseudomonas parafulva TaxID=157782 RepID=A0AAI8KB96_9PSED|nr:hypothetical protein [Pseudomonas parafulva]AXO88401.1 hypothetical protein DZC75_10470 [Pseudomonas parafulva]